MEHTGVGRTQRPPRVLVVDDDEHVVQGLVWPLSLCGYDVDSCRSGEEALRLHAGSRFALVITDVQLPGISGLALLTLLREELDPPHVIVITGFGSPQVELQACEQADAYLTKPFTTQELLTAVQSILGKP